MPHQNLYEMLASIVGSDRVTKEDFARWAVMGDIHPGLFPPESPLVALPDIIARPQTPEEISEILKLANQTSTPVTVRGGGEGCASASMPSEGGILIDMLDMNKILDINEESAAVTVEAACTWAKLTYELKKRGYRTGHLGPGGIYGATIAGSIAHNSYMMSACKYDMPGSEVLSLEVILPTGEIINTGSATNIKADWLMRYANGPDLTGLFVGDEGAFGVKTKATLRIYPTPKYSKTQTYSYTNLESAAKALLKMQLIGYMEDAFALAGRQAVEIFVPDAPENSEMILYGILEGYDSKIVELQKDALDSIARNENGKTLGSELAKAFFDGRRKGGAYGWSWGFGTPGCSLLPTLKFPELTRKAYEFFKKYEDFIVNIPGSDKKAYYVKVYPIRHAFVNLLPYSHFDATTLEGRRKGYELWRELIKWRLDLGACNYWIGLECADLVARNYPPFYHDFMRRIKRAVDPKNILNKGILSL